MKKNNTKHKIYIRTFSAILAAYLVLMIGFSILLFHQEKKLIGMQYGTYAGYMNNQVERILQDHIDSNYLITDQSTLKRELTENFANTSSLGPEIAVFTRDYQLVFNTKDYWVCSYTKYKEGNTSYAGYAYLNPREWYDIGEIKELENYYYAKPNAKKVGEIAGYSMQLESFWLDNGRIIPEKLTVTAMLASSFDEEGQLSSSSGSSPNRMTLTTNYENKKNLPYFEYGSIITNAYANQNSENLIERITDTDKLREASSKMEFTSVERVGLITYRYVIMQPYQNILKMVSDDDQSYYSEFWTVIGVQVNPLKQCLGTLGFVWISCFILFIVVAIILSIQTYKSYQKREELDRYRIETTNALAHDLKTPLSVISGYAQNLIENIHTEKREYYAYNINQNVNHMDQIIKNMLELLKYETHLPELKYEEVSLSKVCKELINRYQEVCRDKGISLSLEGDEIIKADVALIEKVIDNIFVNAINFTPFGGSIEIRIQENILEFYNSGSHIPEEILNDIWQPYIKADASRSNAKGTGLGLSISSKILDLYNFSYGAKNTEYGVIFWFKWESHI